jgi:uncharacterized glyoxalase superfamily protein PhnB
LAYFPGVKAQDTIQFEWRRYQKDTCFPATDIDRQKRHEIGKFSTSARINNRMETSPFLNCITPWTYHSSVWLQIMETVVTTQGQGPVISVMLAALDTPAAVEWYKRALGATLLWSLGSVAGMEIGGAPFFVGEPANNGWESPIKLGITSTRVEVFCDNPEAVVARALEAGATARHGVRDHQMPWGTHRQGGFVDPFGHIWLVGDRSPLRPYPL